MKETHKLIRFKEVSRRSGLHESTIAATRIPVKNKKDFEMLFAYLEDFILKIKKP